VQAAADGNTIPSRELTEAEMQYLIENEAHAKGDAQRVMDATNLKAGLAPMGQFGGGGAAAALPNIQPQDYTIEDAKEFMPVAKELLKSILQGGYDNIKNAVNVAISMAQEMKAADDGFTATDDPLADRVTEEMKEQASANARALDKVEQTNPDDDGGMEAALAEGAKVNEEEAKAKGESPELAKSEKPKAAKTKKAKAKGSGKVAWEGDC